jgi:ubiquinone/menaquinone biosynthesis C-methylase UbiE
VSADFPRTPHRRSRLTLAAHRRISLRARPIPLILSTLSYISPALKANVQKSLIRWGYQLLSITDNKAETTFLNYGYAPLEGTDNGVASPGDADSSNQYGMQLYYRVAGATDLRGKDVLEVSSGRGGGAAFAMEHFHPRSMVGLDFADKAVAFCKSHYRFEGLSFAKGDAENLPFPRSSFDAVINVEASHNYPSVPRFLQEVVRVLRPGGHFLFADLRPRAQIAALRDQLVHSGMTTLEDECITPNVVRSLELDSEGRREFIERKVPAILRRPVLEFAGVQGSEVYRQLASGELQYLRFVLRKPFD